MAVLEELAKHAPSFIWGGLAFWVVYLFHRPIAGVLPRMNEFKVGVGRVEISFIERSMEKAAFLANRNNQIVTSTVAKASVNVTKRDRERVLNRAERSVEALSGRRALWVDDNVANNRLEREMLEAFGLRIEQVQDNDTAEEALSTDHSSYDLLISDIARAVGEPTGLALLSAYRADRGALPVIFYVSQVDADKPLPLGAFGLTNRPDELLHLVIDALERRA